MWKVNPDEGHNVENPIYTCWLRQVSGPSAKGDITLPKIKCGLKHCGGSGLEDWTLHRLITFLECWAGCCPIDFYSNRWGLAPQSIKFPSLEDVWALEWIKVTCDVFRTAWIQFQCSVTATTIYSGCYNSFGQCLQYHPLPPLLDKQLW